MKFVESLGQLHYAAHDFNYGVLSRASAARNYSGYRADFKLGDYDPASRSIRLADFRLAKLQKDQLTQLYKATLNLKVGQTVIYGTAKDPQSSRLLIVVLNAKR